jgi:hypothetical protein
LRSVSPVQPIFDAIEPNCCPLRGVIAAVLQHHPHRTLANSGENRLEFSFVMAPPSQAVEPPANPERFIRQNAAYSLERIGPAAIEAAPALVAALNVPLDL